MPDIKRPNYFTSQFLVEKDFNDEQSYHLNTRRRHNRVLHTSGVAEGLDVTFVNATQVQVGVGTAIDSSGREIVVADALTYKLLTAGSDLDVYLTLSYQEVLDPADHYTQGGLDAFTRTTERPLLQDGTVVPPTDGSVIVLARIRLNSAGAIGASSSIDTTLRTLSSATVAPQAITAAQLADGAVTLAKLATDAQPLAVKAANAITVVTDNTLKQITVGESHSARNDNPHLTTAAQIDSQGGTNQLVTQINAGTGVIARPHIESAIVSGVVTFQNLFANVEMFSSDIDPGFGPGAVSVQLALEDLPAVNLTSTGDTAYARQVVFRSEVNRSTGRFRIFVTRGTGPAPANLSVRWYAFKPQAGLNATVAVKVTVTPPSANLINNATQVFSAAVDNTSLTSVTWSATGGTMSPATGASSTFSPPGITGTYTVTATSNADGTTKGTASVFVNADVTVIMSQLNATVFRGDSIALSANVINSTTTTSVTWSAPGGGSLSGTTANATTFTAPLTPGTYTVVATSTANSAKTAVCTIFVPPVTISIAADSSTVLANHSTIVRATITGTNDNRANWSVASPVVSVSPAVGPNTTFFAPGVGGLFSVKATAVSDTNQTFTIDITVPNVKNPGTEGGGKFAFLPVVENIAVSNASPASEPAASPDEPQKEEDKPRPFIKPKKRPGSKLPPKPSDE